MIICGPALSSSLSLAVPHLLHIQFYCVYAAWPQKMLINISCLVQIIQNNAGHSAREWHPQAAAAALRRVSCGQSAWQPKVNAPSLCSSASQALGCVCVCVSVRCINICVNLSFFVVYEYLNLLQCQTMAMKFSCDHQRQFCFTPPLFVSLFRLLECLRKCDDYWLYK